MDESERSQMPIKSSPNLEAIRRHLGNVCTYIYQLSRKLLVEVLCWPLYLFWWIRDYDKFHGKSQHCQACSAPLHLSQNADHGGRCLYCSTLIGWRYRPFEVKRFKSVWMCIFVPFCLLICGLLVSLRQIPCLEYPLPDRLAGGCCSQSTELTASTLAPLLQVGITSQALLDPARMVFAVTDESKTYFKIEDRRGSVQVAFSPLRLSPSGDWLLLKMDDKSLSLYSLLSRLAVVAPLDTTACQVDPSDHIIDLTWSPDEQHVAIRLRTQGGVQLVKLADFDSNSGALSNCSESYTQNAVGLEWLDNTLLLYLVDEGHSSKYLGIRNAFNMKASPVFFLPLAVEGTLDQLTVAPGGRHLAFTAQPNADASGRQLYWLNLTGCPLLNTHPIIMPDPMREIRMDSALMWLSANKLVYFDLVGQMVLFDVVTGEVHVSDAPPELGGSNLMWLAWRHGE